MSQEKVEFLCPLHLLLPTTLDTLSLRQWFSSLPQGAPGSKGTSKLPAPREDVEDVGCPHIWAPTFISQHTAASLIICGDNEP